MLLCHRFPVSDRYIYNGRIEYNIYIQIITFPLFEYRYRVIIWYEEED